MQTIYALSTAYGKSGVAIIRVSGDNAKKALELTNIKNIKPRYAYFSPIKDGDEVLDNALVLYFNAPHSFTGEDIVEFQLHGSKAVISSTLEALSKIEGYRLAEAGEFSKRAFYNNKMDLTQAEGLADLIDSETKAQQKQAINQTSGGLSDLYNGWREDLLGLLAHLEAFIDFPDEDIPQDVLDGTQNKVNKLIEAINKHIKSASIGERLRDGFRVAIIGKTNAGKSSLLNAIANRTVAIVSDIHGTTRDSIDVYADINGFPVIFSDTAGLRQTEDEIEKQGIDIAKQKAKDADFVIYLFDASTEEMPQEDGLIVANKLDKISQEEQEKLKRAGCFLISAKHNDGVVDLLNTIGEGIKDKFESLDGNLMTRARYKEALEEVIENLQNFSFNKEIELTTEDVRLATRGLARLTGKIEVDEILGKIFSSFCIGK
ncbi:MAG: tRNA uridine-5-carboxymethylaminomethyl(34) synthesis GTPase MnmE [Alphaproteobacteria bacterium]